MSKLKKLELRFTALTWQLLELKFAYYYPVDLHPSWQHLTSIPDIVYDKLEAEYQMVGKKLKRPTPISDDMVGFDLYSRSGALVSTKLTRGREIGAKLFILDELSYFLF